ncbi:MAG: carcinine hydrolase/isopenicillin-N N-acyltransferase family protein [Candidatus Marinimicrobia bacterium]|jgi:hypothetical protein|nr:carcinine hydrolase/isopenicillin-N N-acyltransferase family protein [Candidatus Neomarinimicrobiota bacterium]MDD4961485.1 carcinine hydrolase/isopenicillin-N N-acyltransferase family protein [Candidatus Neomarinimicrobiota bacterium]MDD5709077.1 carcinine hydrolase/isopenicillin-N N-acyltransferase family protein [Candidatus Neomarinimicrobiota bacterium]MDX9778462.1 carcinine hydrolase/isopenicillin-N N-acyltransferase family protein [bacterium]
MKRLIMILIAYVPVLFACTSAVISGKATPDGRPLLWKHRDTGSLENTLVYIDTKGYAFTGVSNVSDSLNEDIWMGINERGFAIMNTASYNINLAIPKELEKDSEGKFMRLALETCEYVDDFEKLLLENSGQWGLAANFGVIDAEGNAAFFETGYDHYIKYDVNDPETAPEGYLIRTNFSLAGKNDKGQGYIRYDATAALFGTRKTFTPEFIIQEGTRNLDHGVMKEHIGNMRLPGNRNDRTLVSFQDYITRYWSASVCVMQGVLPGEDPQNSVIWTIMGFPLTAMTVPVFFASRDILPEVISKSGGEVPLMTEAALKLKADLFPLQHDDHANYLDVAPLMNRKRDGYLQVVEKKEAEIIRHFQRVKENPDSVSVLAYYEWLDAYVREVYKELLP